jgi:hypothetical protein
VAEPDRTIGAPTHDAEDSRDHPPRTSGEIARRERIPLEAALKVASAVDPDLAAEVHADRLGRPIVKQPDPTVPEDTQLTLELYDRVQKRQRETHCSFSRAYAAVCEDDADYFKTDAAAAAVFVSLAASRAQEAGIELGQAIDRLRIETPSLWRRANAARR